MGFGCFEGSIQGLKILENRVYRDERGWLTELGKASHFEACGLPTTWVQTNLSQSSKGVLRGIHFQKPPYGQGKLIRVMTGRVWDAVVDMRRASPTFGEWFGLELSAQDGTMLYIPPGCAHGFLTLEENTQILYFLSCEYNKEFESGLRWDDPDLNIPWPLGGKTPLISEKDARLPFWSQLEGDFL